MTRRPFSRAVFLPLAAAVSALAAGCYVPSQTVQVSRIDERESEDLSGHWNARDTRIVATEIRDQMVRWADEAVAKLGKNPVLIIQRIRNRSMEHIDTQALAREIQTQMLSVGNVSFVADSRERHALDRERQYQDVNASEETRKEKGNEIGADYALSGDIASDMDRRGGTTETTFRITITLSDLRTNEIVWSGQSVISKRVQRAASTW